MDSPGSVTCWLEGLRLGDEAAAQQLWEVYYSRLVRMARKKLHGVRPRGADEEDVALSAFNSFCAGVEQGRLPKLNDRSDLWQVLLMIAARKTANLIRHEIAGKRDASFDAAVPLSAIIGSEPSPSLVVQVTSDYRQLFARLDDEKRRYAVLKMEGLTNPQIAERTGKSLATIERKLALIRRIWEGGESNAR
jgi:DNA-directed RNA polymerase specialized sigma24 family protein